MISTRRIVAAVGLAAGVTGLAAPLANAAPAGAQETGKISPIDTLDSLAVSDIPVERQGEIPRISEQLQGLGRLNDLNQLHQVTDLAAPVTQLLPAVQS
ncbi:hypothetical protein [Streptomyces brasiliensis]|uniref:Secreted protein n=1 Tax=Streptomyces brasiliensis TaxID=1954 RepID=A0A917K3I7_9ACTN|nr:hypothetical protein [Streptomyces brasiliensis]GGI96626.1 hypothetical protein GCM10010121_003820 [Streptomyces brasiliensis]